MADSAEKITSLHPEQNAEITGLVDEAKIAEQEVHTIAAELSNYREIPFPPQNNLENQGVELPKTYEMHSAQEIEMILSQDRDKIDEVVGMESINKKLKQQRDILTQDVVLNEIRISEGSIRNFDAISKKIQQRIIESAMENSLYSSENTPANDSQIKVELKTYQDALKEINSRYQSGTPSNPEEREQYYQEHAREIKQLKEKYGSCDSLLIVRLERKAKERTNEADNKESVMSIHDHAAQTAQRFKSRFSQN